MSYILVRDVVDQQIINTALERSVFTGTIPGGIWPGNAILIEQTGKYNNGNASARSYVIRLRLNGITVMKQNSTAPTANTLYFAAMQRWVLVAVASNQLRVIERCGYGGPGSDTGNFATVTGPGSGGTNRVGDINLLKSDPTYLDFSSPTQLEITVQLSVAAATHEFKSMGVWVVLLGDGLTAAVRQARYPKARLA